MAKHPSPTQRVTASMTAELDSQTKRLVTKLQSEFQGTDRATVSTATYHDAIRQNWNDPMWRQRESQRMGEVPFVQEAMKAFGLDPTHLKNLAPLPDSHMAAASVGLPEPPANGELPTLPPIDLATQPGVV